MVNWTEVLGIVIIGGLVYFFLGGWLEAIDSPFVDSSTALYIIVGLIVLYYLAHMVGKA